MTKTLKLKIPIMAIDNFIDFYLKISANIRIMLVFDVALQTC